ncbi:MAG: HTTM domain-containing protein, partial [Pikeienuella sp.]
LSALITIDYRSLAAVRIMCGGVMIWWLYVVAPDLSAFYTDNGVISREVLNIHRHASYPTLLRTFDSLALVWVVWAIGIVGGLMMIMGWRTRLATVMCWLVCLALVGRNPLATQGGDTLLTLVLFWGMFLPLGAVFSVDAALNPENRRGEGVANIATFGLLLQVMYVYVIGALLKTSSVWVPYGSAVYVALHLDTLATPLAHWFRQYALPMMVLTWFVYWIELLTPVLLMFPDLRQRVRSVSLALLMMMHLGFRVFLNIGHFWLASLTSLASFIPASWWRTLGARYWRGRRYEIWYDRDCGFCWKVASILREFFLPRDTPLRPAQDHPEIGPLLERETSWVVVDHTGQRRLHWDAVAYVMRQSPLLLPIGWLATIYGLIGLGRPTYDLIGNSRGALGRISAVVLRPRTTLFTLSLPMKALAVCAILFCFGWNMRAVVGWSVTSPLFPQPVIEFGRAFGWTQHWNMFAPAPPPKDGYPVAIGTTADSETWDVFQDPPTTVNLTRPDYIAGVFKSHRWRRYANHVLWTGASTQPFLISEFGRFLCFRSAERGINVETVEIFWLTNETLAGFRSKDAQFREPVYTCP